MAFVNVVTNIKFFDCCNDMIKHFDMVHNCFADFTYFEYYATAYINAVFNMHQVSMENFNLYRVELIDALISSHCYFDFRNLAMETLKKKWIVVF